MFYCIYHSNYQAAELPIVGSKGRLQNDGRVLQKTATVLYNMARDFPPIGELQAYISSPFKV